METIQIALSPDLGVSPADFVGVWNDTSTCRDISEAQLVTSSSTQFDPLLTAGLAVLGSVATGLATNALYDLIKHALVQKGVQKPTEITEIKQPDGSRLLVVKCEAAE